MRNPVAIVLFATLAACASVKEVDQNSISVPQATAQIIGARGPLTIRQSKALLERIGTEPGDAGILKRHLAIEQAVAESPLIAGNSTRLLTDGGETFPAMFTAIKRAKQHINLEYYIFEDIQSDGESLGDLLISKRQEGVAVNIIYDSYGSDSTAASDAAPEGGSAPPAPPVAAPAPAAAAGPMRGRPGMMANQKSQVPPADAASEAGEGDTAALPPAGENSPPAKTEGGSATAEMLQLATSGQGSSGSGASGGGFRFFRADGGELGSREQGARLSAAARAILGRRSPYPPCSAR